MLELDAVHCGYGRVSAVRDFSCVVQKGDLMAWLGPNGAGKTSAVMAVMGLVQVTSGRILFEGVDVTGTAAHKRVRLGLAVVPEGRQLFGDLTVEENLAVGAYWRAKSEAKSSLADVYDLFPRLAERRWQMSGTLSGGEQQMVAIGRAIMAKPKLMLIDELSLGLMPKMVDMCVAGLQTLRRSGLTVVLVEQNTERAMELADQVCILSSGSCVSAGPPAAIREMTDVFDAYIGKRR
jgi:branched-chain amino acid transport system ATP-binding protein